MIEQIDYLVKDNLCIEAMVDFKNLTSVQDWVNIYRELFESINYVPEGYPKITDSNFDGESFVNIQSFSIYIKQ